MRRIALPLLLLVTLAIAVWYRTGGPGSAPATADQPGATAEFDFEAQGVVMRQMDAEGRLQYEVVANRIVQLPDGGPVRASGLTLRHDPPGTAEGSKNRWVVNAAEAELPPEGGILSLTGAVRAQGLIEGNNTPLQLAAEQVGFNLSSQELFTDGEVEVHFGRSRFSGRSLRANIATGEVAVESDIHGTIYR